MQHHYVAFEGNKKACFKKRPACRKNGLSNITVNSHGNLTLHPFFYHSCPRLSMFFWIEQASSMALYGLKQKMGILRITYCNRLFNKYVPPKISYRLPASLLETVLGEYQPLNGPHCAWSLLSNPWDHTPSTAVALQ